MAIFSFTMEERWIYSIGKFCKSTTMVVSIMVKKLLHNCFHYCFPALTEIPCLDLVTGCVVSLSDITCVLVLEKE